MIRQRIVSLVMRQRPGIVSLDEEELRFPVVVGRGKRHQLDVLLSKHRIGLHQAKVLRVWLERINTGSPEPAAKYQRVRSSHGSNVTNGFDPHHAQQPDEQTSRVDDHCKVDLKCWQIGYHLAELQ